MEVETEGGEQEGIASVSPSVEKDVQTDVAGSDIVMHALMHRTLLQT